MEKQKLSLETEQKIQVEQLGNIQEKLVNINVQCYRELVDISLSLSHVYMLELAYYERIDKIEGLNDLLKIKGYLQTLIRKDYITDDWKITETGKELYEKLVAGCKDIDFIPKKTTKSKEELFEEWWAEYPKTTHWTQGTKVFYGDRALKLSKAKCRDKYLKILNEGIKHEDLVRALVYEVKLKKNLSISKGENKMEYMKSTESYLNARVFENFIESSKGVDIKENKGLDNVVNL